MGNLARAKIVRRKKGLNLINTNQPKPQKKVFVQQKIYDETSHMSTTKRNFF